MGKNPFYKKHLILLLIIVFVFALISLGREGYRYFLINQDIRDLEKKIEDLKTSNEELIKSREFYQSKEFLEQEIRKKMGYVKQGENVIIIASEQEQDLIAEPQSDSRSGVSNFKLWWEYFFKRE
jgi:cell division protein FtsB